jgi:hypothetical protein
MTSINFERVNRGWVDSLRAYEVMVNGHKSAEIRRGDRIELEVEAGRVEVHLELDWCRSRSLIFDVAEGSVVSIQCRPRSLLTAIYGITLGRKNYMRLAIKDETSTTQEAP